jgi:hypothetical protein
MSMLRRVFDKVTMRVASDMCLVMVSHANAPRRLVSQAMDRTIKYPKEVIIESSSGARAHNYNNSAMTLSGEIIMDLIQDQVPHIANIIEKQGLSVTGVPRDAPEGIGRDIREERSKIYEREWQAIDKSFKVEMAKNLTMVVTDLNEGTSERDVDDDAEGVNVAH